VILINFLYWKCSNSNLFLFMKIYCPGIILLTELHSVCRTFSNRVQVLRPKSLVVIPSEAAIRWAVPFFREWTVCPRRTEICRPKNLIVIPSVPFHNTYITSMFSSTINKFCEVVVSRILRCHLTRNIKCCCQHAKDRTLSTIPGYKGP
jgi:hypothetical protein